MDHYGLPSVAACWRPGTLLSTVRPANGPTVDNHLHTNPYPNTAAPGQPRECEAGNEPYRAGRTVLSNVPGRQQAATEGNP